VYFALGSFAFCFCKNAVIVLTKLGAARLRRCHDQRRILCDIVE
jgi:hypothetical protein